MAAAAVGELDTIRCELSDGPAHADRAVSYLCQRADIDQRNAAIFLDHLPRPLGGAAQAEALDIAHRKPNHRSVDGVDETGGQATVQN